jgi:ketosteroid isomerase-like protein
MSQENVEVVRRIYDAVAAQPRDLDTVAELCHADMTIQMRTEIPEGPIIFRGIEGATEIWDTLDSTFDEYRVEPIEIRAGDDCIAVHCRQSGRFAEGGTRVEGDIFHVWRFRDGKVVEMRHYSTRSEALEAAGLSE